MAYIITSKLLVNMTDQSGGSILQPPSIGVGWHLKAQCHSHVVKSSQVHDDIGVHLCDFYCGVTTSAAASGASGGRCTLAGVTVGPVGPPGGPHAALHSDVVELAVLLDHFDAHVTDVVDDHPDGTAQVFGPLKPRDACQEGEQEVRGDHFLLVQS